MIAKVPNEFGMEAWAGPAEPKTLDQAVRVKEEVLAHTAGACETCNHSHTEEVGEPRTDRAKPDLQRIEAAVREILLAVGENPDRDGLKDTPRRVAKAYRDLFSGLSDSPAAHLGRVFEEPCNELVLLRDIDFHSMCEHHLLPFVGKAHVAYLPAGGKVVGLSKLARTVDVLARRPQVQERLTNQIADALMRHVQAHGVAVVVEAEHFCMKMRGVQKPGALMVTSALRGVFRDDPAARAEVMALIQGRHR